jgi:hypothetical protein
LVKHLHALIVHAFSLLCSETFVVDVREDPAAIYFTVVCDPDDYRYLNTDGATARNGVSEVARAIARKGGRTARLRIVRGPEST